MTKYFPNIVFMALAKAKGQLQGLQNKVSMALMHGFALFWQIFLLLFLWSCKGQRLFINFCTVWKFVHFPVSKNLREINFCESGDSKSAILTVLAPLKFGFSEFLHFVRAKMNKKLKIKASKIVKFQFSILYLSLVDFT